MCGFTITFEKLLSNLIKHRGVESTDFPTSKWFINFNSLPLCSYNRGGSQPIHCRDKIIVFNGEIFNYNQLDSKSVSDVDYLFHLSRLSSREIYLESLKWDGFWSIAIIEKDQSVYFFTDWLGKKQLYYNWAVGLSSEIKPLLCVPYNYNEYSEKSFGTHYTNFDPVYRAYPGALYHWIGKIPFQVSRMEPYSNFHPELDLYKIVDQSVKERLHNQMDGVSILLSGGLDSNIILHHVLKQTKNIDVVTYRTEELSLVQRTCEKYNLSLTIVDQDSTDFEKAVKAYELSLDYGSLLPNYLLFKNCKNSMVLTGDGADELFSGYNRSRDRDTFHYDVYGELPYYHNVRIDRMSMIHTKEARSPLMSYKLLSAVKAIPLDQRKGKKILRDLYSDKIPYWIIDNPKTPLRTDMPKEANKQLCSIYHSKIFKP